MRVLKKVNNVEPPGELSSWYHIPSENGPFSLSFAPSGWQVLCCWCAILKRRELNRGKKIPHQPPSDYAVTFSSLYATIMSSSDGKTSSLQSLEDESIPLSTTDRAAALELLRAVLMVPGRPLVYILCTCALRCLWSDLQGRRREFELDLSVFWLDLERNRQQRKMSLSTRKQRGNAALTALFASAVLPACLQMQPTGQRWKRSRVQNLTSLDKQRSQRGALPAAESGLGSSWISGRTSDCWQPGRLCLAHFPGSKTSLMRQKPIHCQNICLNNAHTELLRLLFLETRPAFQ